MEFGEYFWFFSGDCCLADGFSEFEFSKDTDVDGIEYPRDEKRNQRIHDDIVELD